MPSPVEADDLLQEGFIPRVRPSSVVSAWKAHWKDGYASYGTPCINNYRRKSFQNERFGMEHVPEEREEPLALGQLGEARLLALVQALPEGYRMVFNLFAIEGTTMPASPRSSVVRSTRSQLAKARRMLQQRIGANDPEELHERKTSH